MESRIAFVWDNFGPMHVDRCEAVARLFAETHRIVGLELYPASSEYNWNAATGQTFEKTTVFSDEPPQGLSRLRRGWLIYRACRRSQARFVFLCNYDRPEILTAAILLRMRGCHVFLMGCSKFDDYERRLSREVLKALFLLPYQGAISSGRRARDYVRFLGLRKSRIVAEYNTLSIERIQMLAGKSPAPAGTPFVDRHFTIVARYIRKKNLSMAVAAYGQYRRHVSNPRALHLCGSGPLEAELRQQVDELGLTPYVVFRGFLQTEAVAQVLGDSLCLILPSAEEQFGNVVIEALAMGVPVIVSDNCGARDKLVRSAVNGFVVESDNPDGVAYFMTLLCSGEELWRKMAISSSSYAHLADAPRFAEAVKALILPGAIGK